MNVPLSIGLVLLLSAPAHALIGGHPEPDDSNFVAITTASSNCAGVLLTPNLILTSGRCIDGKEQQHPELIGYFHGLVHGDEDSDRNPVREVYRIPAESPHPDFALMRLGSPLGTVGGIAATGFPIYPGQIEALHDLKCFGLGPLSAAELHFYGNTLASADYHVAGVVGSQLVLAGLPLHVYDQGGVCFNQGPSGPEIAAILATSSEPMSITTARKAIAEFRTSYNLVASNSGMCLGKNSSGSGVWQFPCADPATEFAQDQTWMVRRVPQLPNNVQSFQIRTQRYSNDCLGVTGNGEVGFSPCPPDMPAGTSWPPLLPSMPRAEQIWLMHDLDDGAVQIASQMTGLCISLDGSTSLGTFARQMPCDERRADQRFHINAVELEGGPFRIANWEAPSLCVDIAGASPDDGAAINEFSCHGGPNQNFLMGRNAGSTFHYIQPMHALSEAIEVPNYDSTPGALLRQWHFSAEKNQQWMFSWDVFGTYRIIAKHDGQCMTTQANFSGAPMVQKPCRYDGPSHESPMQTFIIE